MGCCSSHPSLVGPADDSSAYQTAKPVERPPREPRKAAPAKDPRWDVEGFEAWAAHGTGIFVCVGALRAVRVAKLEAKKRTRLRSEEAATVAAEEEKAKASAHAASAIAKTAATAAEAASADESATAAAAEGRAAAEKATAEAMHNASVRAMEAAAKAKEAEQAIVSNELAEVSAGAHESPLPHDVSCGFKHPSHPSFSFHVRRMHNTHHMLHCISFLARCLSHAALHLTCAQGKWN